MRRYALVGRKLGHSFSKRYFTAKFHREGIDAEYDLLEIDDVEAITAIIANNSELCGLNVTIPYKQTIIPYLDHIDAEATAIGAVNCITIDGGRTTGHNTDIEGIDKSLDMLSLPNVCRALVLGTGGAAKAVHHILRKRNIDYHTVSRNKERGDFTYANLPSAIIADSELIINTTPLGMYPDIATSPNIDYSAIGARHRIFDLVYNPQPTLFMSRCRERGADVIGGRVMLEVQAEASWRLWNKE